jgi:hypothetical protein
VRARLSLWRDRTRSVARDHPFLLSLVVLLLVVIPGYVRVQQTTDQLHRTQVASCRAGNEARGNQIDLWNFIIGLSAEPHPTAVQKARIAALQQRLGEIFAPRHCA